MSRRIRMTLISTALTIVIVSGVVVLCAQGQTTARTIQGFPFVEVGKTYVVNGIATVRIQKDLGNGWVETQGGFMNLNQVAVLLRQN